MVLVEEEESMKEINRVKIIKIPSLYIYESVK